MIRSRIQIQLIFTRRICVSSLINTQVQNHSKHKLYTMESCTEVTEETLKAEVERFRILSG